MQAAKSFQDLVVWRKAHQLVLGVYRLSASFPKHELYGLTSQLRRAAVSIPANIAEGFKKRGTGDKLRMLNIAQGSLEEARYYFILAADLQYGDLSELLHQIEEVSKLLEAYIAGIERSSSRVREEDADYASNETAPSIVDGALLTPDS